MGRVWRDVGISNSMRRGDVSFEKAKKDFLSKNAKRINQAIGEAINGDSLELEAIYREIRLMSAMAVAVIDGIKKHPELRAYFRENQDVHKELQKYGRSLQDVSRALHESSNVIFKEAEELGHI